MAFSGEHRPLDCSLPHELTCETPCPSLKLYFLIGILSLSALCIALLVYLCVLRSRISKKREVPAKGTNSRESVGPSYEVFLSFHGRDTRHGFTDFLYRGMVETGILVFRDNESLHVGQRIGDELLQAIRNSKIYIPIFSKNYALSHWCLRELAHMVECASKSNGNKEILPIFFNVEPDDVKLKTNLYSKALLKHQKKFCTEVESWKKALIDVDEIKGWNLKIDESQVDLIRSIIQTVLTKLNVGFKKNVTEDLVGVDDRVEAIIKMLHVGSNSVQFLGLYGMGGIGKTTLAKVIFNQLSCQFQGCKFLSDVGESSRRHGLVHLQKQLLSKFPESRSILDQIHDVDDGINMIKRVLCNKKVLVVLDDMDEREQLRTLADKGDWFGFGSRIIITTRDQRVLTIQAKAVGEGPTNISAYEVYKMESDHALKLFSRHAFRRDSPLDHYISISKKIVRALGNLPLAIEIIGSSLNGKSEALWEDTLKKLKEAPPMEVQRKLMITYERLDDAQKQVFLDIACFFLNEDKTNPSYMWDACGYCPHNALEVLFLMSLIKIKDDNTFWMHDQVRDLGREIVHKENFDDPCERSRVYDPEEALRILKRKEGSVKIKALSLGFPKYPSPWILEYEESEESEEFEAPSVRFHEDIILKHDEFAYLEKLRFFEGYRASFVGDFNNLLSDLKWLSCRHCLSMLKAKNFHPTNLVVLDLSRSNISEKDIDWIKAARKLKVLDLNYCYNLRRLPDLSTLVSLEILRLANCALLESIDWIEAARKLKVLDLSYCKNLRRTPDLSTLEILILTNCIILESVDWIKAARKLKVLDLTNCENLRRMPDLSMLVSLEILRLHGCLKIKKLPDSIGKLQSLIELDLLGTSIDHLPDSFSNLKQLTTLRMREIIKGGLTKLPSAIWFVQFWPETREQHCLKMPDMSWTQISRLPTVASLVSNIHKLEIAAQESRWLGNLTRNPLDELESVVVLRHETPSQVEKQILASPNMRFLLQLPHETPSKVEKQILAILASLASPNLVQVKILAPPNMRFLQVEKQILASPNMRFLLQLPSSLRDSVFREPVTRALQSVSYPRWWMPIFVGICDSKLEKLLLQDCTLTRRLERFSLNMWRFQSEYCREIPPWPHHPTKALAPSHMKNLQEVDLFECKLLVEICGLEELGSLSSLAVAYCRSIERMPDLSKLRKLRELRVGKCPKLRSMEGLERLESLKRLRIHDCRSLESLVDTSNLDLECCLLVRCKRLPHRHNYCKCGQGCYCKMLFEGLRKSDPMEVQQVLQGHPDVAPVRNL